MTNADIADYLSLYAKLLDIHRDNPFKAKAYSTAAFQIEKLPYELHSIDPAQIAGIYGIGESIATQIICLLQKGNMPDLEQLIEKTPSGIRELMQIKGIGPKKIATIWHDLHIESPGELLYACQENRLTSVKGFGLKTQQSIQDAITFYLANQSRYLYASIEPIAEQLLNLLHQIFEDAQIAISGAFARQEDIIDELTFVISATNEDIIDHLQSTAGWKFIEEKDGVLLFTWQQKLSVEIFSCDDYLFHETLFFTTNTPAFNEAFQTQFPSVDFEGNGSEEDIFSQAGIPFIPSFLRQQPAIIERVQQHPLPNIIQPHDIKGIIHNHSKWSDGQHHILEMAQACINAGYEYLVMSDHSVSSFYANGLTEARILQQHAEIDKLNQQLAPFKIFKSIECDILYDGSLDYNNHVLASFDMVIASVHQHLQMTEEKAMQRILTAIQHPYVHMLGHVSGRLLLSRPAYPLLYEKIIKACAQHHVAIEINANPRRLDIDWQYIQMAIQNGVKLSINPDAHHINGIQDVRYGVLSAQKGMLMVADNISSYSLSDFEAWLHSVKLKKELN